MRYSAVEQDSLFDFAAAIFGFQEVDDALAQRVVARVFGGFTCACNRASAATESHAHKPAATSFLFSQTTIAFGTDTVL